MNSSAIASLPRLVHERHPLLSFSSESHDRGLRDAERRLLREALHDERELEPRADDAHRGRAGRRRSAGRGCGGRRAIFFAQRLVARDHQPARVAAGVRHLEELEVAHDVLVVLAMPWNSSSRLKTTSAATPRPPRGWGAARLHAERRTSWPSSRSVVTTSYSVFQTLTSARCTRRASRAAPDRDASARAREAFLIARPIVPPSLCRKCIVLTVSRTAASRRSDARCRPPAAELPAAADHVGEHLMSSVNWYSPVQRETRSAGCRRGCGGGTSTPAHCCGAAGRPRRAQQIAVVDVGMLDRVQLALGGVVLARSCRASTAARPGGATATGGVLRRSPPSARRRTRACERRPAGVALAPDRRGCSHTANVSAKSSTGWLCA
jgi:hypothetical protein